MQLHSQVRESPLTEHTHTRTHLFIVSDELGLHVARHQVDSTQHLSGLQAPDGAGGVNARGACKSTPPGQESAIVVELP